MSRLLLLAKNHTHTLRLMALFGFGVLLFGILLLFDERIIGSDDTVFRAQIAPYNTVFDWIAYRYQTWSGRIFSEAFVYIFTPQPILFWQLATLGMYVIFSGAMFAYHRLFAKNKSHPKDMFMLGLALSLPFLAHKSVLADGGLWVTGAMVYFWSSALALLALYPAAYFITKKQLPHATVTIAAIAAGVVAAGSQEQVGLLLTGMTAVLLGYDYWKRRIIAWQLVIFMVLAAATSAISLLAPGNAARLVAEATTWLPDFYTTPLLDRINYGYRWLLEAFINHSGFLMVGIWIFLAALFAKKDNKQWFDYAFIGIFIVAAIFLLSKGNDATNYWLMFYATWKPTIPYALSSLNLVPWSIVLGCTAIAPLILFNKKPIGYLLSTLFVAAILSAAILLLSPTIYASLWRSFFVPSTMLMIMFYLLFDRMLKPYWQYRFILLGVVVCWALSHYLFQVIRLLHS